MCNSIQSFIYACITVGINIKFIVTSFNFNPLFSPYEL